MLTGLVFLWLMGLFSAAAFGLTLYQYFRSRWRYRHFLPLKKLSEEALRDSFRLN
ncbi:MAG: hypothetical protein RMI34_12550 [Chloroherpetonaceae bacterium]|nr:hypothetical protein [Chloroherpetonaceae bacterium]MCS7210891.1 hypothetical protein [Chloroherpetonaceae bacterium]MDW8020887.1 hypothetical protein [Chloroherpetonaceae bacterium]MDW8466176.1 hypothetical protein [Chloroherpetonaceae bacterium]